MPSGAQHVVVGTTLTQSSDAVVTAAARIAASMKATLHVVSAFEIPWNISGGPFEPVAYVAPPDRAELGETTRREVEKQVARLGIAGVCPVEIEATEGSPHRVLVAAVHRTGAALTVVGAVESAHPPLLGSTAIRVVHAAPSPVLVLRGAQFAPRRVLLLADVSPIAAEVVDGGLGLLAHMVDGDGAARSAVAVEALTVVPPPNQQVLVTPPDLATERAAADAWLARLVEEHGAAGFHLTSSAVVGAPRDMVLAQSKATHPDLVIVGTHGRGGFERFFLGSVADAVIRASGTSVLVVPPRAAHGG